MIIDLYTKLWAWWFFRSGLAPRTFWSIVLLSLFVTWAVLLFLYRKKYLRYGPLYGDTFLDLEWEIVRHLAEIAVIVAVAVWVWPFVLPFAIPAATLLGVRYYAIREKQAELVIRQVAEAAARDKR